MASRKVLGGIKGVGCKGLLPRIGFSWRITWLGLRQSCLEMAPTFN